MKPENSAEKKPAKVARVTDRVVGSAKQFAEELPLVKQVAQPYSLPSIDDFRLMYDLLRDGSVAKELVGNVLENMVWRRFLVRSLHLLGVGLTLVLVQILSESLENWQDVATGLTVFLSILATHHFRGYFANTEEKLEGFAIESALAQFERQPSSIKAGLNDEIARKKALIVSAPAALRVLYLDPELQKFVIPALMLNVLRIFPELWPSVTLTTVVSVLQAVMNTSGFQEKNSEWQQRKQDIAQLEQRGIFREERMKEAFEVLRELVRSTSWINFIANMNYMLVVMQAITLSPEATVSTAAMLGTTAATTSQTNEAVGGMVGASITLASARAGSEQLHELLHKLRKLDFIIDTEVEWQRFLARQEEKISTLDVAKSVGGSRSKQVVLLHEFTTSIPAEGGNNAFDLTRNVSACLAIDHPVFLVGKSGSGKTSMLLAMLHRFKNMEGLVEYKIGKEHLLATDHQTTSSRNEQFLLFHQDFCTYGDLDFLTALLTRSGMLEYFKSRFSSINLPEQFWDADWAKKRTIAKRDTSALVVVEEIERYVAQYLEWTGIFTQQEIEMAFAKKINDSSKGQTHRYTLALEAFVALHNKTDFIVFGVDEPHGGSDTQEELGMTSTARDISLFLRKLQGAHDVEKGAPFASKSKRVALIVTTHLKTDEIRDHFRQECTVLEFRQKGVQLAYSHSDESVVRNIDGQTDLEREIDETLRGCKEAIPYTIFSEAGRFFRSRAGRASFPDFALRPHGAWHYAASTGTFVSHRDKSLLNYWQYSIAPFFTKLASLIVSNEGTLGREYFLQEFTKEDVVNLVWLLKRDACLVLFKLSKLKRKSNTNPHHELCLHLGLSLKQFHEFLNFFENKQELITTIIAPALWVEIAEIQKFLHSIIEGEIIGSDEHATLMQQLFSECQKFSKFLYEGSGEILGEVGQYYFLRDQFESSPLNWGLWSLHSLETANLKIAGSEENQLTFFETIRYYHGKTFHQETKTHVLLIKNNPTLYDHEQMRQAYQQSFGQVEQERTITWVVAPNNSDEIKVLERELEQTKSGLTVVVGVSDEFLDETRSLSNAVIIEPQRKFMPGCLERALGNFKSQEKGENVTTLQIAKLLELVTGQEFSEEEVIELFEIFQLYREGLSLKLASRAAERKKDSHLQSPDLTALFFKFVNKGVFNKIYLYMEPFLVQALSLLDLPEVSDKQNRL